jgi:stage II sporulation protein D
VELLLSARDVAAAQRRAEPALLALRPALTLLLLILTALAGTVGQARAAETIRVALVESARSVELLGNRIEISETDGCCARATWRADVVRAAVAGALIEVEGRRAATFRLRSDAPIRLNGREYASPIDLLRNGPGIAVVSEVPLEEYIAGVIRAETGERWPFEALRAQAVVSRTYAAYHRQLNAGKPYHIVASTAHQQFAGRVAATSPIWGAVQETQGQVLRLDGQLFPAFYHTECGGYTEDPRTVFAARNMPALQGVVCPFSAGSPHFAWTADVRLADLTEALRRAGVDVGPVTGIDVNERTPSLRATGVTIRGTRGSTSLRGNDFRRIVGYDTIKSTLFAVATDGQVARFAGRGYGHGVGLCQWGSRGMAEQGFTMAQILAFYYPGTTLGPLDAR